MNTTPLQILPKALIVDDDPVSIFLTERALKNQFEIISVFSGEEALKKSAVIVFDAILLDINLGSLSMDGIQTMRQVRNNSINKNNFIAALTSFSHSKKWYLDQGFDDLFIKPINADAINTIMSRLFNPRLKKAV